jgi:hypothetical protein
MTSSETLYTKNAVNKLSFLLVTHTAYSDTRFGRYRFLKSGYGAELIRDRMDRWLNFSGLRPKSYGAELIRDKMDRWLNFSGLRPKSMNLCEGWLWQLACSAFQCLLDHTIPVTTAMVTAIQRQHSCGVQWIVGNPILQRLRNLDSISESMRIMIIYLFRLQYCLVN